MADPQTYRTASDELSPTVLKGDVPGGDFGARLRDSWIGLPLDLLSEWVNQGVKARFFGSNTFPADALPLLGSERLIERYPADTDETYKARLQDAWNIWEEAGTQAGIRRQLEAFGLSDIEFRSNTDWNWDNQPDNKSRFWVILNKSGHSFEKGRTWGDGSVWDGGWTWGSTATFDEVSTIRRIIRKFKPGHDICLHIVVVLDEAVWVPEPDGTWDKWQNRNTGAVYWDG